MRAKSVFLFLLMGMVFQAAAQQRTHTVLAGETLYSIARFYEVPLEALKTANRLSGNALTIGQTLVIPAAAAGAASNQTPAETKPAPAAEPKEPGTAKPATASKTPGFHVVQAKETLFSIAKRYGLKADELKALNALGGNGINTGDTLWLAARPAPAAVEPAAAVAAAAAPGARYHTVAKGETLFRIAQLYNMPVQELSKLNQLNGTELSVGQRLRVAAPVDVPAAAVQEAGVRYGRFLTLTWKQGDVLTEVLRQYGLALEEFEALNPGLGEPEPGDKVTVFEWKPGAAVADPFRPDAAVADAVPYAFQIMPDSRVGAPLSGGTLYSHELLMMGHPVLPLGTIVQLRSKGGLRSLFVQVMDRTPRDTYSISRSAAVKLGASVESGRCDLIIAAVSDR